MYQTSSPPTMGDLIFGNARHTERNFGWLIFRRPSELNLDTTCVIVNYREQIYRRMAFAFLCGHGEGRI